MTYPAMPGLVLRAEAPSDSDMIERLHERAFGPGRFARTAFRLREGTHPVASFGFTAHVGTFLAGSVRLTRVLAGPASGVMLGPLTVDPAFEGRGLGNALMGQAITAATGQGFALVLLVGDLAYYGRFGFAPLPTGQLHLPGPVNPARFLALALKPDALAMARGHVRPDVSGQGHHPGTA
jgi:predicted N-acetyltransferase YhbS